MKRKNDNYYYDMFIELAQFAYDAAGYLHKAFQRFDEIELVQAMQEMHEIEHAADMKAHELLEQLAQEPPSSLTMQREDIMALAEKIDDTTDTIDNVLRRMYMFNVTTLREECTRFTSLILSCTKAMVEAMQELRMFPRSPKIREYIIDINRTEEDGDTLHAEAIRTLFMEQHDPIQVFIWSKLYDCLENCCDACEDATKILEGIILKNA